MKVKVLIAFILILGAAALTIVGFSTTWYYDKIDIPLIGKTELYYKYNKVKVVTTAALTGETRTETRGYTDEEIDNMGTQMKFYKTALAMDILAFVNLFFAAIALGIAAFKDISASNATRLKNSLNGAITFLIIATFVFLGLPKARRDDCKDANDTSSDDSCNLEVYKKFYGTLEQLGGSYQWGPHTSWVCVCISMGITFLTTIYVYIAGLN